MMEDLDNVIVELLIAGAIAHRTGHIATLDSHKELAKAALVALRHNGYEIMKAT